MSRVRIRQPVIHTPTFEEYEIRGFQLRFKLEALGLTVPMGLLDSMYYYTDLEGWGKVLADLMFHSSLYKPNRFDCENYALKAMNLCAERYGLNTLAMVIGNIPQGRHGFNMLYYGDGSSEGFMLWEPNEGFPFSGSAFDIDEYGYKPELVLI